MPPAATTIHRLALTPQGRLLTEAAEAADDAPAVRAFEVDAALREAFAESSASGLIALASQPVAAAWPAELVFWREFANAYLAGARASAGSRRWRGAGRAGDARGTRVRAGLAHPGDARRGVSRRSDARRRAAHARGMGGADARARRIMSLRGQWVEVDRAGFDPSIGFEAAADEEPATGFEQSGRTKSFEGTLMEQCQAAAPQLTPTGI
ncbi:MAG: hypothetical protein QOE70_1295 [Chthoniobacter sp.]|jgi:hypothetical protein|nr:hypothetical protein [Chthoniobacter sp.]